MLVYMQRPSSPSYRPGYLAYYILDFMKVSKLSTKSQLFHHTPNQQHTQKCDPQILKPTLTFRSDKTSALKVSFVFYTMFCATLK
jgi:hypothetical protein